jgi:hypothetical protein
MILVRRASANSFFTQSLPVLAAVVQRDRLLPASAIHGGKAIASGFG